MTSTQARFSVSLCATGSLLLLSLAVWLWQLPATLFPFDGGPVLADWAAFVTLFGLYALVMLPFDIAAGYWLPAGHEIIHLGLTAFLARWLRGVAVQGLLMTASALVLYLSGRAWGVWAATGILALVQVLLLALQLPLARLAGGVRPVSELSMAGLKRKVLVLSAAGRAFTGGVTGLPGAETLAVPALWTQNLPAETLQALLLHRQGAIRTGARLRGALLAMAWNLAGFVIAAHLPGAGVERLWEFVTTLVAFTLWSFLGLLVLPSFSRAGVIEADRYAQDHAAPGASLQQAIVTLAEWRDDDPVRGPWSGRLIHPVPSVTSRCRALESRERRFGAWNASRTAQYLSWANFGLLSRAGQSAIGRPELWALPPCD